MNKKILIISSSTLLMGLFTFILTNFSPTHADATTSITSSSNNTKASITSSSNNTKASITSSSNNTKASTPSLTSNAVSTYEIQKIGPLGVGMKDEGALPPGLQKATDTTTSTNSQYVSPEIVANKINQMFHGSSINVRFVMASRSHGNNNYDTLGSNVTNGDPNFVTSNNKFHNIPCYFITISGVQGLTSNGPRGGGTPIVHTTVNAIFDAVNGQPLLIYSVA
jgi:hypothetical protein